MSHMVAMSMPEISDVDSLKRACARLGLTLDTNKKEAVYYSGRKMKCDAVISAKDSTYEIALVKNKDGNYEVHADLYDSRLREIVGPQAGKLSQAYQIEQHRKIARAQGYEVIGEKTGPDGNIELRIKAP